MKLTRCTKEQFEEALKKHTDKADGFAKTFYAKANYMDIWDSCIGAWSEYGELLGAIIVTVSKNKPKVANLQLLHVFSEHRKKNIGRILVMNQFNIAIGNRDTEYFRISAEPDAVRFYTKLGFRFYGRQKSGCFLTMCKLPKPYMSPLDDLIESTQTEPVYDIKDPVIHKAVYRKGKGGCVEVFENLL